MELLEIAPFKKPVTATIEIPGSKSYTNRALIIAVLSSTPATIHNPLFSDDTQAMIDCLRALGLRIDISPSRIVVCDNITAIPDRHHELFARDSGTTMRFLLPLLCLVPGTKTLTGSPALNKRPLKPLVEALRQLGASIDHLEEAGQPPLKISSSQLHHHEVSLDPSVSSQFLSSLLLISPLINGLHIHLKNDSISKPYIDMTLATMRECGIQVAKLASGGYEIPSGQHYQMDQYHIEGDFSSAGYFLAIAALTQSTLTLKNINPKSIQADKKLISILSTMGNQIVDHADGITIVGKQILPLSLDMEDCPDQVQTMAVLAAFANGITQIRGVRSLRVKETERVQALKNELAKMHIKTEDTHDTLTIYGGKPQGATIETYGDHRMAMAFAVAGTKIPGIKINNPQVVSKTFPTFWEQLESVL